MLKSLAGSKHLFVSDELFSGIKELQDFYIYVLVQSLSRAIAPPLLSLAGDKQYGQGIRTEVKDPVS